MFTIHKYQFDIKDTKITMPRAAEIRLVAKQPWQKPEHACIWAMIDTKQPLVNYPIKVMTTGENLRLLFDVHDTPKYWYTATWLEDEYVWHLFIMDESP